MAIIDQFSGPFPAGHVHPSKVVELSENAVADWCYYAALPNSGELYSFSVGREYSPLGCINELNAAILSGAINNTTEVQNVMLFFTNALARRINGTLWDRLSEDVGQVEAERSMREQEITYGDSWSESDTAQYVVLGERKHSVRAWERVNCWSVSAQLRDTGHPLGEITYVNGRYIASPIGGFLRSTDSINDAKRYLHKVYAD